MTAEQPAKPARKRRASAVTTGRQLFVAGDPTSPWARRWRDIVADYQSDVGGREHASEASLALIRRAAALTVECERTRISGRMVVTLRTDGKLAKQLEEAQAIAVRELDPTAYLAADVKRVYQQIKTDDVGTHKSWKPLVSATAYTPSVEKWKRRTPHDMSPYPFMPSPTLPIAHVPHSRA
jgi:hypothetical protein